MQFAQIIQSIRETSVGNKQAGTRFEVLMQRWFLATPLYHVARAWMWADFARLVGKNATDLGIDIVLEMADGAFWAVQCKFYDGGSRVDEDLISHFLGHQGWSFEIDGQKNQTFSHFLWVDTDAVWNKHAEAYVRGRDNFTRIGMDTLGSSNVDWDAIYQGLPSHVAPKTLRDYQREVLQKCEAYFKNNDRGKVIMACGTGKTLTSQRIAEAIAGTKGSLVLYCVPSIALLGQTYQSWAENAVTSEDKSKPAPLFAIGVCSDNKAMEKAKKKGAGLDVSSETAIDSVLPPTTNVNAVKDSLLTARRVHSNGMTVVFTTYQSLQVVADAQAMVLEETNGEFGVFDMVVCDEAHRTTGASKEGFESSFMKIHDNDFIRAQKRIYMTATPRIYGVNAKSDAKKIAGDAVVCSMDDEAIYGQEITRISFGQAVNLGCLSDYKVIILTVDPKDLPVSVVQKFESNEKKEIDLPTATRLVGAIHGLSKQLIGDAGRTLAEDPKPCTRALVFATKIGDLDDIGTSKNIEAIFPEVSKLYLDSKAFDERQKFVSIEAKHVDGSMNTSERNQIISWLAGEDGSEVKSSVCRVVSNVRCLSEGVDVPALDAVIFMAPKKSQIDIVQSVGRVMRNFRRGEDGGKKYGYIILPVALRPGQDVNEALEDSSQFSEVWSVLCALRSHDENFNAQVNAIRLNMGENSACTKDITGTYDETSGKFIVGKVKSKHDVDEDRGDTLVLPEEQRTKLRIARQLELFAPEQQKIYAKLVDKVGNRNYWETWASDVGKVTLDILAHMNDIIERDADVQEEFDNFVAGLRENINNTIDREQAAEMLGQHIVIGPIFDALFADYRFNENNAVSKTMTRMVNVLQDHGLGKDTTVLKTFYASIRNQIGDVTSTKGRQQLIKDLYNRFFAVAFKKTVDRLGIVYTPVECVDFIIHSVEALMKREFNRSLSDENVHILDPFVGTGTFITRLLQSGIIKSSDLERKYLSEIHCNEIVLLAYYVADVNIETTFHSLCERVDYLNYDRICLTDTFEMYERGQCNIFDMFKENSEQIERQRKAPVQVIIGNPPYSRMQKNANDDNQNLKYEKLDKRIDDTYVAGSNSTNKNAMYDSYIRAFRWASDRIQDEHGGIIGFVTNGKWLDANTMVGFRNTLVDEFDSIYVIDLQGGTRGKDKEGCKKAGGNVFNILVGVCMTFLVKKPRSALLGKEGNSHQAKIYYYAVDDYMTREEKLKFLVSTKSIEALSRFGGEVRTFEELTPDEHGDWLNKRLGGAYDTYPRMGDKKDNETGEADKVFCDQYSNGLKTNRDAWCYNYSTEALQKNISSCIAYYNEQRIKYATGQITDIPRDPTKISWARALENFFVKNRQVNEDDGCYIDSIYRPFIKSPCYFAKDLNEMIYQLPKLYPFQIMRQTPTASVNRVICVESPGARKGFSCLMSDCLPDLHIMEASQCFPLYVYDLDKEGNPVKAKGATATQGSLFESAQPEVQSNETCEFSRKSGVTDWIWERTRKQYGHDEITKEDIFYYVYGILHCQSYRDKYQNDFKKALPRIPFVDKYEDFLAFTKAGRELGDLHCNYESVPMNTTAKIVEDGSGDYTLKKLKPASKGNFTELAYNAHVKVTNIPAEAHEYIVNGRSPLGWMIDQYEDYTDKDSGIRNNPNDWCTEHNNPRYILELILRVIEVSVRTMAIVKALPKVEV